MGSGWVQWLRKKRTDEGEVEGADPESLVRGVPDALNARLHHKLTGGEPSAHPRHPAGDPGGDPEGHPLCRHRCTRVPRVRALKGRGRGEDRGSRAEGCEHAARGGGLEPTEDPPREGPRTRLELPTRGRTKGTNTGVKHAQSASADGSPRCVFRERIHSAAAAPLLRASLPQGWLRVGRAPPQPRPPSCQGRGNNHQSAITHLCQSRVSNPKGIAKHRFVGA